MVLICRFYRILFLSQFRWTHGNHTFGEEDVSLDAMRSYISVNALKENFGTYTCYARNTMGDGTPCEIEVTGKTFLIYKEVRQAQIQPTQTECCNLMRIRYFSGVGLLKTMGGSNMVIIITIVIASIVLLIIAAIIAVLLCKRRKPNEKCKLDKMILSNNVVVTLRPKL